MPELLKPPPIPSAILNFFSSQPDFQAVAGDMAEEFQLRARTSGAKAGVRWYWRETFRNAWALTLREICRKPVGTIVIALGCFVAVNLLSGLYVFLSFYPRSIGMFLHPQYLNPYLDPMEFVRNHSRRDLALLLQFIAPLAMGWIGGRMLAGREWALTLMFTFVSACAALPASYLLAVLREVLPTPLMEFMIATAALRLIGFWLGALWFRQSRNERAIVGRVS
jgi:hypothetical protein